MNSHAKVIRGTDWAATSNGHSTAKALPKIAQADNWLTRFKSWFQWENLIVAGREVKGFVVSPGIAAVILAFILGLCATIYWRLSDQIQNQRDLIVELRATLKEKSEQEKEYRLEVKQTLATQKVYFDSLSNQVYTVKGLLSPEQSKRLDQATKPQ